MSILSNVANIAIIVTCLSVAYEMYSIASDFNRYTREKIKKLNEEDSTIVFNVRDGEAVNTDEFLGDYLTDMHVVTVIKSKRPLEEKKNE